MLRRPQRVTRKALGPFLFGTKEGSAIASGSPPLRRLLRLPGCDLNKIDRLSSLVGHF
jgi:hypothetical protein